MFSTVTQTSKPGHIPRPPNAWVLYRRDKALKLPPLTDGRKRTQTEISQILGLKWKAETEEVRKEYYEKAEKEKQEHTIKYPDYKYEPKSKALKDKIKEEKRKALEVKGGLTKKRKSGCPSLFRTVPPTFLPTLATTAAFAAASSSLGAISSSSWLGDHTRNCLQFSGSHFFLTTPFANFQPSIQMLPPAPLDYSQQNIPCSLNGASGATRVEQHTYSEDQDAPRQCLPLDDTYPIQAPPMREQQQVGSPNSGVGSHSGKGGVTGQPYITYNFAEEVVQNASDWDLNHSVGHDSGSALTAPINDATQEYNLSNAITGELQIAMGHMEPGDTLADSVEFRGCEPPFGHGFAQNGDLEGLEPSTAGVGIDTSVMLSGDADVYEGYSFEDFIDFDGICD